MSGLVERLRKQAVSIRSAYSTAILEDDSMGRALAEALLPISNASDEAADALETAMKALREIADDPDRHQHMKDEESDCGCYRAVARAALSELERNEE